MANMSASILRNLVSSVFKVDSRSIRLSGDIAPDWTGHNTTGISYCDHSESGDFSIWGFDPLVGLKSIGGIIANTHMSCGNHDRSESGCETLSSVKGVEEFIFFVVFSGDDSDLPHSMGYTIFKAPNFKEYFQKVNVEETQRWATWIEA